MDPFAQRCCCDLKRFHVDRYFCRRHDVVQEDELPAFELRPVAQVEILGQRVVLPAARGLNSLHVAICRLCR